jgi:hypothetical protein
MQRAMVSNSQTMPASAIAACDATTRTGSGVRGNGTGRITRLKRALTRCTRRRTFADSRLVACVCKARHGWKSVGSNARKAQYDALVKQILPPDRVTLWEKCEADSWRPARTTAYDWKLLLAVLKQELRELQICNGSKRKRKLLTNE